jgi:serine/threonine protein kinase
MSFGKKFTNVKALGFLDYAREVWKGEVTESKQKVIIKQIRCSDKSEAMHQAQIQNLLSQDTKCIPRILELLLQEHSLHPPYCNYFLVMERVRGRDLFTHLMTIPFQWTFPFVLEIFPQCVKLIEYYLSMKIIHNDICLDNFILQKNGAVWGIDFGHAYSLQVDPQVDPDQFLDNRIESKTYASPQTLLGELCSATSKMVWCLGVMLYFMIYYDWPFDPQEDHESQLFRMYSHCFKLPHLPYSCNKRRLFPSKRFEEDQIQAKMLLVNDLLLQLLDPDWTTRLSFSLILNHPVFH